MGEVDVRWIYQLYIIGLQQRSLIEPRRWREFIRFKRISNRGKDWEQERDGLQNKYGKPKHLNAPSQFY